MKDLDLRSFVEPWNGDVSIGSDAAVLCGNCLERMKALPDNCIDAIVSDPPYGLGFMGKDWDHGVPGEPFWFEALRVAKPGAWLIAFGGTRTYHYLAMGVDRAGWEIRDMGSWLYGTGFPKSLNVGKAVDKLDAAAERLRRRYMFTAWFSEACELSNVEIDRICGTRTMARHWTDTYPNGKQPDVPIRQFFEMLLPYLSSGVPNWVFDLVDERTVESENFKAREVVGEFIAPTNPGFSGSVFHEPGTVMAKITKPATEEARRFDGYGTALKPACEPFVLARKPFAGTVAANCVEWGTGALNVDGGRVETEDGYAENRVTQGINTAQTSYAPAVARRTFEPSNIGRYPANLLHDGSAEVLSIFPQSSSNPRKKGVAQGIGYKGGVSREAPGLKGSEGSAARFFASFPSPYYYCGKATKKDREEGLDNFAAVRSVFNGKGQKPASCKPGSVEDRMTSVRRNTHPTVKPTDLMRYLIRLVSPPVEGLVILDPFMGSGSTGKAAMLEGARFIGCELSPAYVEIAEARIAHAQKKAFDEMLGGDGGK